MSLEALDWKSIINGKATSSNRAHSTRSLHWYSVALPLYRDKWITINRLWWLSQRLVTHEHYLAVIIYLHVAPSPGRHSGKAWQACTQQTKKATQTPLFHVKFMCMLC